MAVLDLTEPVDRVRLNVGDYLDIEIFPDSVYEYLLEKNTGNEIASSKEAAYLILGALSQKSGRQRLDRIEIHNDSFDNYLKFLKEFIKNPSGGLSVAGVYAGGISKSDMLANWADPDIVQHPIPTTEVCVEEYYYNERF